MPDRTWTWQMTILWYLGAVVATVLALLLLSLLIAAFKWSEWKASEAATVLATVASAGGTVGAAWAAVLATRAANRQAKVAARALQDQRDALVPKLTVKVDQVTAADTGEAMIQACVINRSSFAVRLVSLQILTEDGRYVHDAARQWDHPTGDFIDAHRDWQSLAPVAALQPHVAEAVGGTGPWQVRLAATTNHGPHFVSELITIPACGDGSIRG
jgi:hypothetical protein